MATSPTGAVPKKMQKSESFRLSASHIPRNRSFQLGRIRRGSNAISSASRHDFSGALLFDENACPSPFKYACADEPPGRFDPLFLLLHQPPTITGVLDVKKNAKSKFLHAFDRYYAELRGTVLLTFMPEAAAEDMDKKEKHALITGVVSVLGVKVAAAKGHMLKIRMPLNGTSDVGGSFSSVAQSPQSPQSPGAGGAKADTAFMKDELHLRFDTSSDADEWEHILTETAGLRRICLSSFQPLAVLKNPNRDDAKKKIEQDNHAPAWIFLVRDKRTRELLVVRRLSKSDVFHNEIVFRRSLDERLLLQQAINRPFLVQLRYAFQTKRSMYLITEFQTGGDLVARITPAGLQGGVPAVRRITAELALALDAIHSAGFVHRGVSLENVLIGTGGHIALGGFGTSKRLDGGRFQGLTSSVVGLAEYQSPEMKEGRTSRVGYGISADMWSFGIFLYTALEGKQPGNLDKITFAKDTPQEARTLCLALLNEDPLQRIGCGISGLRELQDHGFFSDLKWDGVKRKEIHKDNLPEFTFEARAKKRSSIGMGSRMMSSGSISSNVTVDPTAEQDQVESALSSFPKVTAGKSRVKLEQEAQQAWATDDDGDDVGAELTLWPMAKVEKNEMEWQTVVGFFLSRPATKARKQVV